MTASRSNSSTSLLQSVHWPRGSIFRSVPRFARKANNIVKENGNFKDTRRVSSMLRFGRLRSGLQRKELELSLESRASAPVNMTRIDRSNLLAAVPASEACGKTNLSQQERTPFMPSLQLPLETTNYAG
jgi:hypothetical protein